MLRFNNCFKTLSSVMSISSMGERLVLSVACDWGMVDSSSVVYTELKHLFSSSDFASSIVIDCLFSSSNSIIFLVLLPRTYRQNDLGFVFISEAICSSNNICDLCMTFDARLRDLVYLFQLSTVLFFLCLLTHI